MRVRISIPPHHHSFTWFGVEYHCQQRDIFDGLIGVTTTDRAKYLAYALVTLVASVRWTGRPPSRCRAY